MRTVMSDVSDDSTPEKHSIGTVVGLKPITLTLTFYFEVIIIGNKIRDCEKSKIWVKAVCLNPTKLKIEHLKIYRV